MRRGDIPMWWATEEAPSTNRLALQMRRSMPPAIAINGSIRKKGLKCQTENFHRCKKLIQKNREFLWKSPDKLVKYL
jgi:hypothetical protein